MNKRRLIAILAYLFIICSIRYSIAEVEVKKEYYDSGQLYSELPYENGKLNGLGKTYYENGQLFSEVTYVNGEYDGTMRAYYESGELESEMPYRNGVLSGIVKEYYKNESLQAETPYQNGKVNGVAKSYSENGIIESLIPYKDDEIDGIAKTYREGKIDRESSYKAGKRDGLAKVYNADGTLDHEIPYKNDRVDGELKYYGSGGNVQGSGTYKNGELVEAKYFDGKDMSIETLVGYAKDDIYSLGVLLERFKLDTGSYPDTSEGLKSLLEEPPLKTNWQGPYSLSMPIDPWGNDYHYGYPGVHNKDSYDLSTFGPDGIESEDDITNWGSEEGR
ncbi:MAG: type II secretion system protein GspG [Candidatus Omnitrophota bacterium]